MNSEHANLTVQALSIIITVDDEQILEDVSCAYGHLTQTSYDSYEYNDIRTSGWLAHLINLLNHDSSKIRLSTLSAIGNIATGDNEQTQYLLNMGLLKKLALLLQDPAAAIKRETCWTISNIR